MSVRIVEAVHHHMFWSPAIPDQFTTEAAVIEQVYRNLIFCFPLIRTRSDLIKLRNNIHTIRIYAGM